MWRLLLKPWIWAAGSAASAYLLSKKQKNSKSKLREAKLELIEQQRTIDRLRAELGRERALRQAQEGAAGPKGRDQSPDTEPEPQSADDSPKNS